MATHRRISDLPVFDRYALTEDQIMAINKKFTYDQFQKITVNNVLENCPDELLIKHIEKRGYEVAKLKNNI